jgi:predicted SnoaL-like aldol condensation-catalyzing enzyme
MSMPDGPRPLFERLQQCARDKDWETFASLLDEAASAGGELTEELEAKKALVRRYFEMWNTGAGVVADDVLGPTYVDHANPDVLGPAAARALAPRFHAANPDARLIIEAIAAEGEFVTVRNAVHRTRGGKEVVSRGMAFFRVANGKLVEQWSSYPGKAAAGR